MRGNEEEMDHAGLTGQTNLPILFSKIEQETNEGEKRGDSSSPHQLKHDLPSPTSRGATSREERRKS